MAEFRVESLTYAHSRARPVPIAALTGYGLPLTATIPAGCSINIGRPSRLEPRTFETGTCAATTRSPTLYRLSYGTGYLYAYAFYLGEENKKGAWLFLGETIKRISARVQIRYLYQLTGDHFTLTWRAMRQNGFDFDIYICVVPLTWTGEPQSSHRCPKHRGELATEDPKGGLTPMYEYELYLRSGPILRENDCGGKMWLKRSTHNQKQKMRFR